MRRRNTGAAQEKFEERLGPKIQALVPGSTLSNLKLYPARGYWRQTKADVQQFTGSINVDGLMRSIGGWESMSDCLRYGFEVHDERGVYRADADFVCEAKGRRHVR